MTDPYHQRISGHSRIFRNIWRAHLKALDTHFPADGQQIWGEISIILFRGLKRPAR
jgi:hypothetical protein